MSKFVPLEFVEAKFTDGNYHLAQLQHEEVSKHRWYLMWVEKGDFSTVPTVDIRKKVVLKGGPSSPIRFAKLETRSNSNSLSSLTNSSSLPTKENAVPPFRPPNRTSPPPLPVVSPRVQPPPRPPTQHGAPVAPVEGITRSSSLNHESLPLRPRERPPSPRLPPPVNRLPQPSLTSTHEQSPSPRGPPPQTPSPHGPPPQLPSPHQPPAQAASPRLPPPLKAGTLPRQFNESDQYRLSPSYRRQTSSPLFKSPPLGRPRSASSPSKTFGDSSSSSSSSSSSTPAAAHDHPHKPPPLPKMPPPLPPSPHTQAATAAIFKPSTPRPAPGRAGTQQQQQQKRGASGEADGDRQEEDKELSYSTRFFLPGGHTTTMYCSAKETFAQISERIFSRAAQYDLEGKERSAYRLKLRHAELVFQPDQTFAQLLALLPVFYEGGSHQSVLLSLVELTADPTRMPVFCAVQVSIKGYLDQKPDSVLDSVSNVVSGVLQVASTVVGGVAAHDDGQAPISHWRRRFFALQDSVLFAFSSAEACANEEAPEDCLDLGSAKPLETVEQYEDQPVFELDLKHIGRKPMLLCAKDKETRAQWVVEVRRLNLLRIKVVAVCVVEEFLKRGLDKLPEGIFRISGLQETLFKLRDQFFMGEQVDLSGVDEHNLAGLLKLTLREIGDPLLTFELYQDFVEAGQKDKADERSAKLAALYERLPAANCALLSYLAGFLYQVSLQSAQTKMGTSNLAIVFGPNILRPRVDTVANAMDNQAIVRVVDHLLTHHADIWPTQLHLKHLVTRDGKDLRSLQQSGPGSSELADSRLKFNRTQTMPSSDSPQTKKNFFTLNVTVEEAKDLKGADFNGLSDPYVKIEFGGVQRLKTKAIAKTLNPKWQETFSLSLTFAELKQKLCCEVMDKDPIGRDDSLGKCFLPLEDLVEQEFYSGWLPLRDVDKGMLKLTLQLH
eukprot:g17538.t1